MKMINIIRILFIIDLFQWYNAIQTEVRLAGMFNFLSKDDAGNVIKHKQGNQILAAYIMAINELNNKNDGIYDDLLPNTQIKFIVADESDEFITNIETNIDLNKNSFSNIADPKPKLHGIIGGLTNRASDAIAQVANGFKLTQVAYGSTGSFLSYIGPYPYFLRTVKDDAYEGVALADIIYEKYKWDHVSVFSTTDSYGSDLSTQFQKNALNLGITIVNTYSFRSGQADFTSFINDATSSGARIFVLLMPGADAGRLLSQGYKLGLFKENVQIVGSSELTSPECINAIDDKVDVQDVLRGALSLELSDAYKLRSSFQNWVTRWRAQTDTIQVDLLGVETCDIAKDDNQPAGKKTFLYQKDFQDSNGNALTMCTGLKFNDFEADGSDIDVLAPYAYDAVIAWATGVTDAIQNNENIDDVETSGDVLGIYLCASSFRADGITGPISFSTGDETGYGYGDRELGTEFLLVNFQPNDYCHQTKTGGFKTIAVWNQFSKPKIQNYNVEAIYNSADNNILRATPEPNITVPAVALSALLVVFAAIGLMIISCSFFALLYYRENKIIKMSQPLMIILTLVGSLACILRVLWGSFAFTNSVCSANFWFGHIGFVTFNTTLIMKTWRVHLIVNTSMKKVKISITQVMVITLAIILAFLIYLAFIQGFANIRVDYLKTYLGQLQYRYDPVCVNEQNGMITALYFIEAALIAQGGRLCYLTRNAPDSVNDSKSIATTTYTIIFLSVIIGPIVWLIQLDPYIANFLVGIGFAIGTISGISLLLGPKFLMIVRGATVDSKLNVVYKNSLTGKKIADDTNVVDPALTPNDLDAKKLKAGRGNSDENTVVCKEHIIKWTQWLTFYENQTLFNSITNSSTTRSNAKESSHNKSVIEDGKEKELLTSAEDHHVNLYSTKTHTQEV